MRVRLKWAWVNPKYTLNDRNYYVKTIHANNVQFNHEIGKAFIVTDRDVYELSVDRILRIISDD